MREITVKLYQFDELSDTAKEKARDWFREGLGNDDYWKDGVFEDAKQCFALAGFRIDRIYFSGFASQGDGACFEGGWKAEDVKPGELKKHAPQDRWLHRISEIMEDIAKKYPSAWMRVRHSGHYYHEHCTEFDMIETVDDSLHGEEIPADVLDTIKGTAKDAMRWIYRTLEKEWDYQNSDEVVDQNIMANEYEFDETGRRCTKGGR